MHTAFDVKANMLEITEDGCNVAPQALLNWSLRDRLGVVIDEPVGALGAGLTVLAAISCFYDTPDRKRRQRPLYPEIYLFHAGGPWGMFLSFDFFPDHKEVFVQRDAPELLRQINNRGITHLLIPEQIPQKINHRFKEPEASLDRVKLCFAYSPTGSVENASVRLTTENAKLIEQFREVLNPLEILAKLRDPSLRAPSRLPTTPADEAERIAAALEHRANEVSPLHPSVAQARERIERAKVESRLTENIRSISPADALNMLAPRTNCS